MLKEKTRWRLNEWDEERAREIADALNIPRLLAALLVSRGMDTQEKARFFLHTDPDQFHDPFQLDGMETAVERIRSAVQNQEPILIYGDYDVDGVSSTTLMLYTLKKLGAECTYYIPDRFTEGYGLNKQALEQAKQSGHTLVVTVDTGISACEEAEYAKELGSI